MGHNPKGENNNYKAKHTIRPAFAWAQPNPTTNSELCEDFRDQKM